MARASEVGAGTDGILSCWSDSCVGNAYLQRLIALEQDKSNA
jgi:hypothetical protein